LLGAANEEIFHLKRVLQEKERELSKLKQHSLQMMSYVRALITMNEEARSSAKALANAAVLSGNLH
jgi:hypothetical protein